MSTSKDMLVSDEPKRYDPIHWSDMGGWSYDSASIKEASDGDFVRFEDHEAIVSRLRSEIDDALKVLREVAGSELNADPYTYNLDHEVKSRVHGILAKHSKEVTG